MDAAAAVSADVPPVDANPMGSLAEWIRCTGARRAIPAPVPTARACRDRTAPAGRLGHAARRSPLLPSPETLLYGTLPLMAGSAGGYTGGARRHRSCPTHPIGVPRRRAADTPGVSARANTAVTNTVPKILIVGGGYAGFYTAWKLEKHAAQG